MNYLDIAKAANKVIHNGITLMPEEMKRDFATSAAPGKYINTAIEAAITIADEPEKEAMIAAYAVQEANRVVSELWREEMITKDIEEAYRKLPRMKEMATEYNKFVDARNAKAKELEKQRKAILAEDKKLDVFKGVINGYTVEESAEKFDAYRKQIEQAAQGR